jgi:Uncharacterised nucleotidyltransferase
VPNRESHLSVTGATSFDTSSFEAQFHRCLALPLDREPSRADRAWLSENATDAIAAAASRRLTSLARAQLTRHEIVLPQDADDTNALEIKRRRAINMIALDQTRALLDALHEQNIDALAYKGQLLAQAIYGSAWLRDSGDIDLIVSEADTPKALETIVGMGYRAPIARAWWSHKKFLRDCSELPLTGDAGRIEVDLHWRFAAPWWPELITAKQALDSSETLRVGDAVFPWIDLQALWLMQLAHVLSNEWRESKSLIDLAQVSHRISASNGALVTWHALHARCKNGNSDNAFDAAILLLADLFGVAIPEAVQSTANGNNDAKNVAQWCLGGLGHHAREHRGGERLRLAWRIAPTRKVRELIRRALSPTHEDFVEHNPANPMRVTWHMLSRRVARNRGYDRTT